MFKNWMKPLVLIGLLGIILYSGIALNVFNDGHTHSHAHSAGGIAEHHHDDEEIANVKRVVESEPKVEKNTEVENEITQPQEVQVQHESKQEQEQEHDHAGHEHKH